MAYKRRNTRRSRSGGYSARRTSGYKSRRYNSRGSTGRVNVSGLGSDGGDPFPERLGDELSAIV